jgi:hypothetical protein
MTTHTFVTLKMGEKGSPSIQAKMMLIPFDMTETCKPKAVVKIFLKI